MAGKFINTDQKVKITSIVEGLKSRLTNPYYLYSDQKGTLTNYYNLNYTESTLDEATRDAYSNIGSNSPFRFNKIEDLFLYGIPRIDVNYSRGDYGLEADSIEFEATVLPDTIVPNMQDYFRIKYIEQDILFKVTNITIDTLENGANAYRISAKLDLYDRTPDIEKQVVEKYRMIVNNMGTNFSTIIRSDKYDLIEELEKITSELKTYFYELFHREKVQTFIFGLYNVNFYDSYMIEFIKRNKILKGADTGYIHVDHMIPLQNTFSIDYNNTFFRSIELKDKDNTNRIISSYGDYIDYQETLMYVRSEEYFSIRYSDPIAYNPKNIIYNFPKDIINKIKNNELFTDVSEDVNHYQLWNLIIMYFNDKLDANNTIQILNTYNYSADKDTYYLLPIIIFIIEAYIKKLM